MPQNPDLCDKARYDTRVRTSLRQISSILREKIRYELYHMINIPRMYAIIDMLHHLFKAMCIIDVLLLFLVSLFMKVMNLFIIVLQINVI